MAKTMQAVVHAFRDPLTIEGVPIPTAGSGRGFHRGSRHGICHTEVYAADGDWPVKPCAMPCGYDRLTRRCLTALAVAVLMVAARTAACAEDDSPGPNRGKELFLEHCASCHGADGRGAGPAAAALKTAPADLTQIGRAHGGKFPFLWVVAFIDGERAIPPHGSREMPVWGREFRWRTGEYGARSQIYALTYYIQSIHEQ